MARTHEPLIAPVLSAIAPPFAAVCHPDIDRVERDALAWVSGFVGGSRLESLKRTRAGRIAARTVVPSAPAELVSAYARSLIWGFWFDDVVVDDAAADDPRFAPALASVIDILDGRAGVAAAGEAVEAAFADLLAGLRAVLPPDLFARWCVEWRTWLLSTSLQNTMRASRTPPTIPAYTTSRRYAVCAFAGIVVADAAQGQSVDWSTYYDHDMIALRHHAAHVTAWHNDIFSYFAERDHPGEFWNLPSVYASTTGCDEVEALHETARRTAAEMAEFGRYAASLAGTMTEPQRTHVRSMENWITGLYTWSREAAERYTGWTS